MNVNNQSAKAVIEDFISIQSIEDRYNSCPSMYEYMEPIVFHEVDVKIRLRYSPEQNQKEFAGEQKKYEAGIEEIIEAYVKWIDYMNFYENRTPNAEEWEREKNAIKKIIKYIDERMDPERFFEKGPDDTAFCGKFLIRMDDQECLDEDYIDMVLLLSALQWLMRKEAEMTALSDEDDTEIEEEEDTAMLRKQIEKLDLLNEKVETEFYPLLYALRDAWHMEEKTWAQDNAKFAEKTAPILKRKAGTITKGLNRACELLRKDKGSLECYPLSTLQAEEISICGKSNKTQKLKAWQERVEKIKTVMS